MTSTPRRSRDRILPGGGRWARFAPLVVVVVGFSLSAWVGAMQRGVILDERIDRLEAAADLIAADIRAELDIHVGVARGAAGLIAGSENVDQSEYSAGMSAVLTDDLARTLRAANYIRRLDRPDGAVALEQRTAEDPSFAVFPEQPGDQESSVIWLVHPIETNSTALGFDVTSMPASAQATARSLETGSIVMSDTLQLVQETDESPGFVVYVPVADDRGDIRGWAAAVFVGQRFVERSVETDAPIALRVIDHGPQGQQTVGTWPSDHRFGQNEFTTSRTISIYGQEWTVAFEATEDIRGPAAGYIPAVVFAMGLFITGLASVLVWQMRRATDRARAMVEERTHELAEANADLVTALEAKDTFLSVVSHEFRTPLTVIQGSAELMADEDLEPSLHGALVARIHRNAKRLGTLVTDLLVAAQIENGKLDVVPQRVVVAEAVEVVCGDLGQMAAEIHVLGDSEVAVVVDRHHLGLMISNLISNAAKYGAPPVEIRVEVDGTQVMVAVRDHGRGVPPAAVPRLFQRFEQGDNGRTRRVSGVGLGLSIVESLAHLNGGSIVYTGGPDGACFEIRLPLAPAEVPATSGR